jgi:hypothetical protein
MFGIRLFAVLECATHVCALNKDYSGYFHFANVVPDKGAATSNEYVTPGDGANALGYQGTGADLDLAKHICDRYDSCMWFNRDTGFPGSIGWWNQGSVQYLKTRISRIPQDMWLAVRAISITSTYTFPT